MNIRRGTEVHTAKDYLYFPAGVTEVSQGEWKRSLGVLATMSVSSCVALVSHNSATRTGLLGHFSAISDVAHQSRRLSNERFDTDVFDSAIDAIPRLGPVAYTEVWVGGGLQYPNADHVTADKLYAEEQMRRLQRVAQINPSVIAIDWNRGYNDLYLRLDCQSGELLIQQHTELD